MPEKFRAIITKTRGHLHPQNIWRRLLVTVIFTLAALSAILFLLAATYVEYYRGQVYPGVRLGNYSIGRLSARGVAEFVENINNRYSEEGISLQIKTLAGSSAPARLNIFAGSGDNAVELIRLDANRLSAAALPIGRGGTIWHELFAPLYIRYFGGVRLKGSTVTNNQVMASELAKILTPFEDKPHNASLIYNGNISEIKIQDAKPGTVFDLRAASDQVTEAVARLNFVSINLEPKPFEPTVTAADIATILPNLEKVLNYGVLSLSYVDPQTELRRDWVLDESKLASWLEVSRDHDGTLVFSLDNDLVNDFINSEVRPRVDVAAQDAKFKVVGDKVEEFQGSRSGVTMDLAKSYADLEKAWRARNYSPVDVIKTVNISVQIAEPKIKTADVNALGITEVIGLGVSTFKDSHTNRIKNIGNAVKRLNGVLIKPNEVFSANKYAGPYTTANGFLPEAVIKGREIKPEVGGGMCQIGTTLFRMAMNSGMDITQRRNHSLVVSYYADPVNGNPGTDATLYEPMLDLKFKNDTGNYLLLQTDVDYKRQQLTFTLWGKPDGRKGWYTHPTVSKWIPAGEPQKIEVSDGSLKVGQEKCQAAFRGAVASFKYTRVTPLGEQIDRVFDSYYRPLPKICMVGVASASSTPSSVPLELGEAGQ
ncbi:MAG: VanW family protein [Candidatus Magasanikbacteria bacterium]|nr:VanW family protein [Candidatus Magasanikbacteria bacterium]